MSNIKRKIKRTEFIATGEAIKNGMKNGYYRIQAYPQKGINDEFLEMHNYSKKEAYEGLEMLLKKNGYDDIENIL